ncbi:MAG TPA: hypothetical protein VGN32_13360 [Ktedonobacterales bacterium]|jgi:hypothetical protein|nr:hypothetical protein [Ktedonobacterales bacterium]
MSRFEQKAEGHLRNPEVADGYWEMESGLQLMRALEALREQQHLTYEELARDDGDNEAHNEGQSAHPCATTDLRDALRLTVG